MTDTPTFRTSRPRRRGQIADLVRDLADYDRFLAGVPSDHPGLPLMWARRVELAAIARDSEAS